MNRERNLLEGSEMVQHHRTISKDLPEIGVKLFEPSGSWFEDNKLNNALDERYSLLKEPRIEKDSVLSIAKWDPEKKKVLVVKKRGKEFETYGHHDSVDNLDYLNPEEALFLVESNSLVLHHGNREVSVEICYSLLLSDESGCDLEQYRVFSHLSRLGYKLVRHKKPPRMNEVRVDDSSRPVEVNGSSVNESNRVIEEVFLIDDSSSDSSNDDVVILDGAMRANDKEVIDIMDDDSCDSDIVLVETPGLIELPLENWSYVHRSKFLSTRDNEISQPIGLDVFIVSQPEYEILNEIPNIKSRKTWLFRPDERLVPDGVWPFHFKYLIDLNQERNDNRGRGGYRGRGFRGRGWYLQRQVYQMKNYTMSLMNMVSQLMGSTSVEVIPPPPCLFRGQYSRFQRGANRQTWGRISFNGRGTSYNSNGVSITEIVELSDEEDSQKQVKTEQDDDEDVKPKRIKLESNACIEDSSLVKLEPSDIKREIKTESDRQLDGPSLNNNVTVKSENILVKSEKDKNISSTGSNQVDNIITNSSSSNMEISCQNVESCTISCISSESCDDSVDLSARNFEQINDTLIQPKKSYSTSRSCEENAFGCSESDGEADTGNRARVRTSVASQETADVHPNIPESCEKVDASEKADKQISHISSTVTNKTCSVVSTSEKDVSSVPGKSCESLNEEKKVVNNFDSRDSSFVDGANDDVIMLDEIKTIPNIEKNENTDSKHLKSKPEAVNDTARKIPYRSDNPVESVSSGAEEAAENKLCRLEKSVEDVPCDSQETVENISCISEESVESIPCSDEPLKTVSRRCKSSVKCLPSRPQHLVKSVSRRSDEPMVIDEDSMDVSVISIDKINKPSEHPSEVSKNIERSDVSDKRNNWKGLKEMEKGTSAQVNERLLASQEIDEDNSEDISDLGTSLIQPVHCSSIEIVLKRLQIFKQFESSSILNNVKDIKVTYDIYLPQRPYYRNLPPHPDFRLIILRLEDNFPSADEMTQLKKIYNDKINFLFAVTLKESIAYYLYNNVFLPIDDSSL